MEKKVRDSEVFDEKSITSFLATTKGLSSRTVLGILIGGLGVMLALFHLATSTFGQADTRIHGGTHLCLVLALVFLLYPLKRKSFMDKLNGYFLIDLLFILAAVGASIYACWDTGEMEMRTGMPNEWDVYFGTVLIVLIFEAGRRTMGYPIVLVALFFLLNVLFGPNYPGIFNGPSYPWETVIDIIFLQNNGFYGLPIQVMSFYIILFMYFGAFLMQSKAGEFFINLSYALAGRASGGPAKVAVMSSGFFGSISGSAVANVLGTGSFTIPMMKSIGYPKNYAGAVEACASTGGMIMPPVMGATAFLIAEFLGVTYWEVCVAAFIPATLYFFSVFMMVHFQARKLGLRPMDESTIPRLKEVLLSRGFTLISLIVMVTFFAMGYSVVLACLAGLASIIIVSFINPDTRMSPVDFLDAFSNGSRAALMIAVACAICGIIIGSIFITGVGQRFTYLVLTASHGYLWLALILTAMASYILGMGMPPSAVYLTLAILVIPALIKLGIPTMASHMYAFYFGSIAAITPPVAMAAFAGAAVSGGNPTRTSFLACRIGIASYIIPFMFVYSPVLLFEGDYSAVILALFTAIVGVICLAGAMEGWLIGPCNFLQRGILLAGALTLINPGVLTDVLGLASFGSVILMQKAWWKKPKTAVPTAMDRIAITPTSVTPTGSPLASRPQEKTLQQQSGTAPHPLVQKSSSWTEWIVFVVPSAVIFWVTYQGMHFTRYWLFLTILTICSFTMVIVFGFFLKRKI